MKRKLERAARTIIKDCLGIRKNEKVVVVFDKPCQSIAYSLWSQLIKITDPIIIEILPRTIHGEEPPQLVAAVLKNADVFILPTSYSLTHTRARINATNAGARGATMPGITEEIMARTLNADYKRIASLTLKTAKMLTRTKKVLIKTEAGTSLELDISGRKGYPDTGLIKKKREFSNLPAGEAYVAPLEKRSKGTVVIDGSFAPIGFLRKNVIVEIKDGEIIRVHGNPQMEKLFAKYGNKERTLCEFGIGTNYKAKITGNVLEDEKVMGSIHVAFGNNLGFGGRNNAKIHLDGIVKRPSVWLDKKLIIKSGKFVI
ncbi:MAG TPA: aminopeptidase [candidate division WOR-3 bacterium]|uniref:Aminopeptidase n=1 Tax=candidate division WOR-3 bacterium TaxID=2052148 RepID=A0A9C9JZM9_UNCW3|nr:aminopeptidase [candidate division WOR-3 bacterium]